MTDLTTKYLQKYRQLPFPVKAGMWFTISSFLQKTISFLTMPIFTRLLTTEEYGIVTIYNSWESIFLLLVTLNVFYGAFNTAMMDFEKERDNYSSGLVGFITFSSIIWFLLYFFLKDSINQLTGMTFIMSCIMFVQIFFQGVVSIWLSRLKFSYDYIPVVIATVVLFGLSPILSIIGIYQFPEHHVEAKLIGHASAYALVGVYCILYLIKRGRCFISKRYWFYAISFSAPLVVHYLASIVLGQADRIMISKYVGDSFAAIYAVAYSVSMILTIMTTSANQAFVPWLFECIKKDSLITTKNAVNSMLIITVVSLFYVMLFGPEIIMILATQDYYQAKWAIPPIMGSLFFTFVYQLFANIEFYFKKTIYIITASIVAAIVNIILNFIFIRSYGFLAAAYTTLICYILFGFFHFFCAKMVVKKEGLHWPYQTAVLVLLTAVVVVTMFCALVLYKYSIVRYILIILFTISMVIKRNSIMRVVKQIKNKGKDENRG